jgi:hypothetical protein
LPVLSGATPSQSTFTVTIPNQTLLLDSKSWNPVVQHERPVGLPGKRHDSQRLRRRPGAAQTKADRSAPTSHSTER